MKESMAIGKTEAVSVWWGSEFVFMVLTAQL